MKVIKVLVKNNSFIVEELYQKNLEENEFAEDDAHGIGEDADGNS